MGRDTQGLITGCKNPKMPGQVQIEYKDHEGRTYKRWFPQSSISHKITYWQSQSETDLRNGKTKPRPLINLGLLDKLLGRKRSGSFQSVRGPASPGGAGAEENQDATSARLTDVHK